MSIRVMIHRTGTGVCADRRHDPKHPGLHPLNSQRTDECLQEEDGGGLSMTKQQCIAYIVKMLWLDYAFAVCPEEQGILILKLLVAIEEVEEEAKRERYHALYNPCPN
jgi:hypothetical protein